MHLLNIFYQINDLNGLRLSNLLFFIYALIFEAIAYHFLLPLLLVFLFACTPILSTW